MDYRDTRVLTTVVTAYGGATAYGLPSHQSTNHRRVTVYRKHCVIPYASFSRGLSHIYISSHLQFSSPLSFPLPYSPSLLIPTSPDLQLLSPSPLSTPRPSTRPHIHLHLPPVCLHFHTSPSPPIPTSPAFHLPPLLDLHVHLPSPPVQTSTFPSPPSPHSSTSHRALPRSL